MRQGPGPPFRRSTPKGSGRLPSPCFLFVDVEVVLFFSSGWSLGRVRGEGRFFEGPAPAGGEASRLGGASSRRGQGTASMPRGRPAGPSVKARWGAAFDIRAMMDAAQGPSMGRGGPRTSRRFPDRTLFDRGSAAVRSDPQGTAASVSASLALSPVGGMPFHRHAGWFPAWCKSAKNRRKTNRFSGKIPRDATICAVRPA